LIGDRAPSSPPAAPAPLSLTDKQVLFERLSSRLVLALEADGIAVLCFRFIGTFDEELKYFNEGKSQIDPRKKASPHQKRLAKDFVIVKDGVLVWERTSDYERLGALAEDLGLTWGGRWKSLNDIYHVEYRGERSS
jgi:hypothetical protein